ncbi:MAG: hypothetical protein JWM20_225 [Patescibacteria group bacterium]|nr:hypothetical protein [Patescibacteria group bacterium]
MDKKKAVIVGGGFGGVKAALELQKNKKLDVILVSDNPNFEYYPGLHKLVGVSEHAVVSIPLATIFKNKNVTVILEKVMGIDGDKKTVTTSSQTISAEFIVVAVGSQTEYFGISGLKEMAFGLKSVAQAMELRAHVEEMFQKHAKADKAEAVMGLHMVVVGAGPNGTDLAGELASFGRMLAKKYAIPETMMTIDLVEGAPRVLPMMSENVSMRVMKRLQRLGVDVLCNRDLRKEEGWTVEFADMKIGAKTLVWTAGITTNELVKNIPGLILGKKNRIAVDDYLQPKKTDGSSIQNVFIVGDAADTKFSGLAQTAITDGSFVANAVQSRLANKELKKYVPQPIAYNIGVGPRWSVFVMGTFEFFGILAYAMRSLIDTRFFLSILPVGEVWKLYFKK